MLEARFRLNGCAASQENIDIILQVWFSMYGEYEVFVLVAL